MPRSSAKSKTDWERVRRDAENDTPFPYDPEDGPYDPNDSGAADAWLNSAVVRHRGQRGPQKSPTKERIAIRLSPDVVEYFRARGEGWQGRINAALHEWVEQHRKAS